MKLTNKEIYQYLIVYQRYALTRWNHLQPASFFIEAIDILSRWLKDPNHIEKSGFNWVDHTAKQLFEEFSFNINLHGVGVGSDKHQSEIINLKNDCCKYITNLSNFIESDYSSQLRETISNLESQFSNQIRSSKH